MKRVLIVAPSFPPDAGPGTHRVMRFVRHLDRSGWAVHVLTLDAAAFLPGTPRDDASLARIPSGVAVTRTGALRGVSSLIRLRNLILGRASAPREPGVPHSTPGLAAPGLWGRVKDSVTDVLSVPDQESGWLWAAVPAGMKLAKRMPADVVFSTAPPFTAHVAAEWIARLAGVGWVADFRDPWSRSPWLRRGAIRPWQSRIHERLERRTIERAAAVVLNTAAMRSEFAAFYGPTLAAKFVTIPNGYDGARLEPYKTVAPARNGTFSFVHAGSLYNQRDPRPLLEALASVRARIGGDVALDLHLVGTIAESFQVPRLVETLGLADIVKTPGKVSHDESLARLAAADVLVVIQPGTGLQVPAKLYEYMGLGKPILALTGAGAVADLVREGSLGVVADPQDRQGIEEALTMLISSRDRLERLFTPASGFVQKYDGEALSGQLRGVLESVAADSRRTPSRR